MGEPKDFAAAGWIILVDQPNLKLYQYPTRKVAWDWRLLWKENK